MLREPPYFEDAVTRFESLALFRRAQQDPVLAGLAEISRALSKGGDARAVTRVYYEWLGLLCAVSEEHGYTGNAFARHVTNVFLNDENPFSLACERGERLEGTTLRALAKRDAEVLRFFLNFDAQNAADSAGAGEPISSYVPANPGDMSAFDRVASRETAEEILTELESRYRNAGAGELGLYKMFRLDHSSGARLSGVKNPDGVTFADIVGYSAQKSILRGNTEAFLSGAPANNMLLAGPSGTGKSSCVKALANEYSGKGLRLLKTDSSELKEIHKILGDLGNRGKYFIVFIDDLSFEAPDENYLCMKSMLEGDVRARPRNVMFCATSNRRHMMRELWSDRVDNTDSDELHAADTVSEKLSLADRFGLDIYFPKPSPREYQDVVLGIAKKENLSLSEEFLREQAMKWEVAGRGFSGRAARQFINSVIGETKGTVRK